MVRIRLDEMKTVLRKVLAQKDISEERAGEIAVKVMSLFGYDTTITDNLLCKDERDLFYLLEEFDIVTAEEEAAILPSGKRWRIHYWRLKENKIRSILEEREAEETEKEEEQDVYDKLSESVWKRAG
ncbi:MAG: DUF6015 family protein [Thermoplasmata archaeon]